MKALRGFMVAPACFRHENHARAFPRVSCASQRSSSESRQTICCRKFLNISLFTDIKSFPTANYREIFLSELCKQKRNILQFILIWFPFFPLSDINELNLPKTCTTDFPDPDDLLNFKLIICPDEGFYKGGRFVFNFRVGPNYPHEPPKVKCETQVYHPNIDLEGNVCLNILREDWKPVLTINSIVYGLQYLFLVSTNVHFSNVGVHFNNT